MKLYKYTTLKACEEILKRPSLNYSQLEDKIKSIFSFVEIDGDAALISLTKKFDNVILNNIYVSKEEFEEAENLVNDDLKIAISVAYKNIYKFHKGQLIDEKTIETTQGIKCYRKSVGIQKIGLYIPGGTAPLFSTVLMLAIPAKIAQCKDVVLSTPPMENGKIHPAILYTAKLCGITKVIKIGGAQAIAAFSIGTDTINKVDKIFGPGNSFVTAAKQYAQNLGVAIDMPAGPSEVLVIADKTANPKFVAADLLSQAEHGVDSQSILISTDEFIIKETIKEIGKQLKNIPRRNLAEKSLENSNIILVKNLDIAINISNAYAPEHLILSCQYNTIIDKVYNAGSVFLGNYTPESIGDYASGTNHTLPTNGFAKAYSGLSLESFMKKITFQEASQKGLENIAKSVEIMAETEELIAHKNAISIRISEINKSNKIKKYV